MKQDQLKFQAKLNDIVSQIEEKRTYINECLGISSIEGNVGTMKHTNTNRSTISTAALGIATASGQTDELGTKANDEDETMAKDPFQDSIRLLNEETSKLEGVMNNLLGFYGTDSSNYNALQRPGETTNHSTSTDVDIMSDYHLSLSESITKGQGNNSKFCLASRIAQENGEEIQIYEKETDGMI
jgi:hypothetical protein